MICLVSISIVFMYKMDRLTQLWIVYKFYQKNLSICHIIFLLFFLFFFLLYNTVLVLPYIDMNPPRVYMSSQSWTRFPPISPYHLSGSSQCTIPQYPLSCINPRLYQIVSYMIVYMFQCHSPKSSHPLPLPQSPKDCSIHLCLFCCLTYRVIITIFLNSIYMC